MIEYCEICKKDVELERHLCPNCGRHLFAKRNKVRYGEADQPKGQGPRTNRQ